MSTDRNLVFGMQALQQGLVSRDQVLDAMTDWTARKDTSLGAILRERGVLTEERVRQLDGLVGPATAPSAKRGRAVWPLAACALFFAAMSVSGLWPLQREQARTAQARDLAQENLERAEQAQKQAERNFEIARKAVDEYFVAVNGDPLPHEAEMEKARGLFLELEKALRFYHAMAKEAPDGSKPNPKP